RPPREEARGLEKRFHLHEVTLNRAELRCRDAVPNLDSLLFEHLAHELERRSADPDRAGGDRGSGSIEGCHYPLEAFRGLRDLRAAEDVVERYATILQDEHRGVRRADAELVLELRDTDARRAVLDYERFDAGSSRRLVNRRPHHHEPFRLAKRLV